MPDLQSLPWSAIAIVGGVLLLLWGQVGRAGQWWTTLLSLLRPATPDLSPHEVFNTLYTLRAWCERAGQQDAVTALETVVLPAIIRGGLLFNRRGPSP